MSGIYEQLGEACRQFGKNAGEALKEFNYLIATSNKKERGMNIEQEIRAQIEKNRGLKLAVGEINNHLSILEGLLRNERDDAQKRVDEAYQRGLKDAWEAARKIADMWTRIDNDELLAIFGITERIGHSTIRGLFEKQTANEAMLELEAYEEKQKADDEIKVGDEVKRKNTPESERGGIVTKDWENSYFIMWSDGSSGQWDKDRVVKTGRHFDIEKILEEMRE